MKPTAQEMLASEGGQKAIPKLGPFPSKLGREELWELIDMWEFSPRNKKRIKDILESDPNIEGPHLFQVLQPQTKSSGGCGRRHAGVDRHKVLLGGQLLHLSTNSELPCLRDRDGRRSDRPGVHLFR